MTERRLSFPKVFFAACMVFLFVPLLVLIVFSFNANKAPVFTSFSLVWYRKLFGASHVLWDAFVSSVIIALSSALTATVIGTLAAIGVNWHSFRLKPAVRLLTFVPLALPEIIIGLSLLAFFAGLRFQVDGIWIKLGLGTSLGYATIFIAHVTFCLPFVYLLVLARLQEFDRSILEAARDLGASETGILFDIIVPMAMPGIVSGFITALTLSLEDFTITYFVSGVANTLPMVIYNQMYKGGVSPVVNALSTIMILGTVALAVIGRRFLKDIAGRA